MTTSKLTDTQLVLLSAASQREDGLLSPPANLKGGALAKVASKLLSLGVAQEVKVRREDPAWRTDDDETPVGLKITEAGLHAIGIEPSLEPEPDSAVARDDNSATAADAQPHAPVKERDGSKRALVVQLLSREEGAKLDDLVRATGWLPHTTRAALTGLRHRGYQVAREKGNDGASVYRIAAAPPSAEVGQPAQAGA